MRKKRTVEAKPSASDFGELLERFIAQKELLHRCLRVVAIACGLPVEARGFAEREALLEDLRKWAADNKQAEVEAVQKIGEPAEQPEPEEVLSQEVPVTITDPEEGL